MSADPHPPAAARAKPRHHWIVRLTHWVNVVALALMVGSGLRIFNAYPRFARRGETFCCWPLEGTPAPAWLTFGGWLAGARNWHFAMMWVLVVNALVYLGFVYLHGEWRDLVPRRGDPRDAWEMIASTSSCAATIRARASTTRCRSCAYFAMPFVGAVIVLSGIAIWKPVSLGWLTDAVRRIRVGALVALRRRMLALVRWRSVHVFMVFAVDPYRLRSMIDGRLQRARFRPRRGTPGPSTTCSPAPPRATATGGRSRT